MAERRVTVGSIIEVNGLKLEITPEIEFVTRRAGHMVGKVLSTTEATFVPGDNQVISQLQIDKYKQLIEDFMYDFRNEILRVFCATKQGETDV